MHRRPDERRSSFASVLAARMRNAYDQVAERARSRGTTLRLAAYELGIERVVEAGRLRRHRGYV